MQTQYPLSPRRPVRDTLAMMAMLSRRRRGDVRVRNMALRIVGQAPPLDDYTRMIRIREWVRTAMPYERDPRGVELISDPLLLLEKISAYGTAAGDCDDAATLISALLESIGITTRFAAVSVRRDKALHHVGVEAFDRRGNAWRYLDPYEPQEVGNRLEFTATLRAAV